MKTIKVRPNQSVADMVIMACGTMEGAMHIMKENNTSLTAETATGAVFSIPDTVPADAAALRYLEEAAIE